MTELATRTPVSWQPPEGMNFEEWEELFNGLWLAQSALPWLLGDCLNAGEAAYGEDYSQALPESTRAKETLRVYKWVAEKNPVVTRVTELSWSHHRAVSGLEDPAERVRWLDRAVTDRLTSRELKQAMKPVIAGPASEPDGEVAEPQAEVLAPVARPTVEYHDADEDQLESLKRAWNRAGRDTQNLFLEWAEDQRGPVIERGAGARA